MTEDEITKAVEQRKPYFQEIIGPRVGGPNAARARPGYVVTGIHCTGSVTGRYAVDGMAKLTVHFTHISDIVSGV